MRNSYGYLKVVIFSVVVVFMAGCGGKEGGLGQPCYPNETCNSPYVCDNGTCVELETGQGSLGEPCYPNNTCNSPYVCENGTCVEPETGQGGLGEPCYPNNTCNSPYICVEGICEPSCESLEETCTEEGYDECLEDMNGYRICGYFSEEYPECLVWGETELCEEDEVCIDGECVICGDEGEPCCVDSVCNTGFQCNNETGMCETHGCTGLSTEECGNCGVRTRTCEDGEWSDWGECTGEGECAPSATQEQECGNNGTQTRTCDSTCRWGAWGECEGEGDCVAGEARNCGNCGTQTCESGGQWGECTGEGVCAEGQTRDCTAAGGIPGEQICTDTCEWGTCEAIGDCVPDETRDCGNCGIQTCDSDGNWGECTGEGVCSIGTDDFRTCGNCGTQTRECTSSCEWGDWGTCSGEGICTPDDVYTETCGDCGTRVRECTTSCEWGEWGECTGEGVCTPGAIQEQDCGNTGIETRVCAVNCQWEDWSLCIGEMVTVPAGPYMMGCNEAVDDDCHSTREHPYHEVNVPEFEIDKYQVTQGLYRTCVDAGDCAAPSTGSNYCNWNQTNREDHPANCITWHQARAYCQWAGKRLCSESEWEKAARGTDGRKYPWGNQPATCVYAVMNDGGWGCGEDRTWPVGSKPPGASPYGALDMAGNVWEWVEDDWHADYNGAPTDGSAWVDSPRASIRVRRGGSFGSSAGGLRASERGGDFPGLVYDLIGVRCCR